MGLLKKISTVLLTGSLLLMSLPLFAQSVSINLTPGVTPMSHDIYDLHMIVFWICVGIGMAVFGVMFYALLFHRKSRGVKPAKFHEHWGVEMIWAVIPLIILVVMAIPATLVIIRMHDASESDITIKVTGYQWKWQYQYLDQGISFFSNLATTQDEINNKQTKGELYLLEVDKPLVIPIDKKVRFLITSNDVIHSWWVPDFGIKKDAIPGFINEAWAKVKTPGVYRGQCAELCGVNHGFMPIVVEAKTQTEFDNWVQQQRGEKQSQQAAAEKTWTKEELMAKGEEDFNKSCAACHQQNGLGLPPAFPAMKGSKVVLGPVENHINVVVNGVKGTTMQAFGNQLSDVDIAAIITYERNAWGNNTGDVVTPQDIEKFKAK